MKLVKGGHMDRTKMLSDVILKIREYMADLQNKGFEYFREKYLEKNLLSEKLFDVKVSGKHLNKCKFVDVSSHGEIILESDGEQYQFSTGDISISAKS
jgi:biotin-(acetyl-CoA carboxylase) ligase